jgi:signal peptidase I
MTASEDEHEDLRAAAAQPSERSRDETEQAAEADPAADGVEPAEDEPAKPKKKISAWMEIPILIVIALVLTFLIQTFLARVYVIPSESMEQTLNGCTGCTGDRILVDRVTYDFSSPQPGDVIVFKGPPGWDQDEYIAQASNNPVVQWIRQFGSSIGIGSPPEYDLVKRVIAVGGQTVSCCDAQQRVLVDGKPLDEPYIYLQPGFPTTEKPFAPVTVPPGDLWVMGDNRNNSNDSRFQNGGGLRGVVPVGNVIGKARTIIWPPGRWGGIGDVDPHPQSLAAPAWEQGVPPAIGALGAWPTLWLGRRTRRALRGGARRATLRPRTKRSRGGRG